MSINTAEQKVYWKLRYHQALFSTERTFRNISSTFRNISSTNVAESTLNGKEPSDTFNFQYTFWRKEPSDTFNFPYFNLKKIKF
jgi:hypothetical protein